jgi:UDP-glucose 4-epimerase
VAILVTGGAGYIGSVTVELLQRAGESVVVIDNLSRGHADAVDGAVPFYRGSIGDRSLLADIVEKHRVSACIHLAAFAYVGESVENPALYFENNVAQTLALLEQLLKSEVKVLVYSSTCATYGNADGDPIKEDHPQHPTNPYGWSKLFAERMIESYAAVDGLRYVILRYFNAAGASVRHGERHDPEPHLIPRALDVALGIVPYVSIFGNRYPTPDGTAVRDYIHVSDLASAHLLAMNHLRDGGACERFNLGNGSGYSVRQVIEAGERVTGRTIPFRWAEPRHGDPHYLVAEASKAHQVLGWRPNFSDLEGIVRSAWQWRLARFEELSTKDRDTILLPLKQSASFDD